MTGEETNQIRKLISHAPRSIWGYWPFVVPVLVVIVGVAVIAGLVIYWETKMPDLEVLFKSGKKVVPVWDSELIREAVMVTALAVTATFIQLAVLARLAFKQIRLLRAAAKELGIEEIGPEGLTRNVG